MKFIFSYLKKYLGVMAWGITIKFAGAILELLLPYIMEHLIDEVVPRHQLAPVLVWGILMIVLSILVRQMNVIANRSAIRVAKNSTYEMRRDLFRASVNLSGRQFDAFGLPSLTSRMTSDSYNVQNFIRAMQAIGIRAPILLLGGIGITLIMDPGLASILCIMAPILIVVVVFVSFKGIPLYHKVQNSVDDIVRIMRENIIGIRVVKALSKEPFEINRFETVNVDMAKKDRKAGTVMAMPGPIMTLFLNCGLTFVVIIGARRVNSGQIEPGVILAFLTYFNMILNGVMGVNRVFMLMSKANASASRMAEVINAEDEMCPIPEEKAAVTSSQDYIVFEHVDFTYDVDQSSEAAEHFAGSSREKCLYDIDFSIKKGGSLGVIGATGSGKTTIVNLLMRFYDPDKGHVFVDGKDVRTYDKDDLHRMFGVVFQNDVIFADSLISNIAFGRDVSLEDVKRAAADARAAEFIEAYEDGYEHQAVIAGANLSGGQKQRTLITRALVANPEILILDDSSSALDYKTDAALRKSIREHHGDATTIIIAQRISSIMNLDHILVLHEGRCIGYGTHEELMAACETYQEIFQTQMGEELHG